MASNDRVIIVLWLAKIILRHLPFHKRYGVDLMRGTLSSCLIGNVFLPGEFSSAKAMLGNNGTLSITGGFDEEVPIVMAAVAKLLRSAYWQMGVLSMRSLHLC